MSAVPKLWPGSTIVCLGSGPSLTREDVDYCRGKARVIAINDSYRLAPWADVLYACDGHWWQRQWRAGAQDFAGMKVGISIYPKVTPGVQSVRSSGDSGLELDPSAVRTGKNSGYQAINLAVHLGASRILLLGYDMAGDHWFGSHPDKSRPPFALCLPLFPTLVQPLREQGIEIVNCSRRSAIKAFQRMPIEAALPAVEEAVAC